MKWRALVVVVALFAAVLGVAILAVMEEAPKPTGTYVPPERSPLRTLAYTATTRRGDFVQMGMSDELADRTAKAIAGHERNQLQLTAMLKQQADLVAPSFCPGDLPQPYAALRVLVDQRNGRRSPVDSAAFRGFQEFGWVDGVPLQALHARYELSEDRPGTLMAISAVLLGREQEALDRRAPFVSGPLGGGWSALKSDAPHVESLVVGYFSLMHYLTQLANRDAKICG